MFEADSETIARYHREMLYPVVRVRTPKAGGSGTVIYSEADPANPSQYLTFVLTNHHVVSDAITLKKEWDSVVKRQVEKDILSSISVEVFEYVNLSLVDSTNSYLAEIIAYDVGHDLALLRLLSPRKMPYIAAIIPRSEIGGVTVFSPVMAVGCSLLHAPFGNPGMLTYLTEILDNRGYWQTNAAIIFGNSGGSIYLLSPTQAHLIGVPAKVTVQQYGFGMDVVYWMNYCIPPDRIYQFLDEQEMRFLYDPADSYEAGMSRRRRKMEEARRLVRSSLEAGETPNGVT